MKTEHLTIAVAVLCVAYAVYVVHDHASSKPVAPVPSQAVVDEQYRLHYSEELALRAKQLELKKHQQWQECMDPLSHYMPTDEVIKLCNAMAK